MVKKLVVTALANRIVYGSVLKSGRIGSQQTDLTEQVLRATNEWFLATKKKTYGHAVDASGKKSYVFHTDNEDKKEKIMKILMEDE